MLLNANSDTTPSIPLSPSLMTNPAAPSKDWANALTDFIDEIGGDGPGLWKWAGITPTPKEVVDELRLLFKHFEQRATASGARSVLKFDPQDRDESIRLAWGDMTSDQAVKGLKALVGRLNGLAAPPVPQTPAPGAEFLRPTMDEVMRLAKTFGVEVNDCHALMWLVVTSIAAWGDGPETPSAAPVAWCRSDDFRNALFKQQSFSGWREQHPNCDMALYAQPWASAAPGADQAEGPSLDDVAELCAEFEYHIDSDGYYSLEILRDMITAAITRWRAPVVEPVAAQDTEVDWKKMNARMDFGMAKPSKPNADRVLKLAAIIREVDLRPDANTFVLGENELAEAILAHPDFSGCHDGPAALPAPDHLNLIGFAFGREPWATWLRQGGCLESAHCELSDLMLAVLARWGRPATLPAQ